MFDIKYRRYMMLTATNTPQMHVHSSYFVSDVQISLPGPSGCRENEPRLST